MNHWVDTKVARLLRQKEALNKEAKKLEDKFTARVSDLQSTFTEALEKLTSEFINECSRVSSLSTEIEENILEIQRGMEAYKSHVDRKVSSELRKLQREVKDLEVQLEETGKRAKKAETNTIEVSKAKTIAIFDAILFNISNWSSSGDTAPDFELISQAVLFPIVYERAMKGEVDYILEEVPVPALEVVRRGREYVKHFRSSCPLSLVDPLTWSQNIDQIKEWWINDALPLIYGERPSLWDDDAPFSLQEMIAWRDYPANRMLSFPLIYDGMSYVEKHRDEIREESGLPEFNKKSITTRLEALNL